MGKDRAFYKDFWLGVQRELNEKGYTVYNVKQPCDIAVV